MPAPGRTLENDLRLLALGFLLGILGVYSLPRLLPWPVFLLAIPVILLRWSGRAPLASVLLGMMMATYQADHRLRQRLADNGHSQDVWLTGHIASLPERHGKGSKPDWRFLFAPVEGGPDLIRLSWYRSPELLRAGECWRFLLRLKPPHGQMNPGGFDYEAWLFREGIGATGYVRSAERCPVHAPPAMGRGKLGLLQFRQHLVEVASPGLDRHSMSGMVLGLTVGDTSAIGDEQWRVMRRTGITHLVSISGLHITLAAGFVYLWTRWLWACWPALLLYVPAQRAAAVMAMLSAMVYALLAGFTIPTQRALVMLLVVMGASLASRQAAPSHLLCVALLAVLLMDPSAILSPGFWLSFGAVAWMLFALVARLGPVPRWRSWLVPQGVLSVALVVPCLFWFGESSLVSPLVNLLLIPLFGLLIPWLLLSLLLIKTALGLWMIRVGADCLELLWRLPEYLAATPGAYWTGSSPSVTALIMSMLGLTLLLAPRGIPARVMGFLFCLPLLIPTADSLPDGQFELTVLDVGQGHAAVVRTRHQTLLFDTGPAFEGGLNSGETAVLPFLRQLGIRHLDRVVLSHGDLDHRGGLDAIRANINIGSELGTQTGSPCQAGDSWHWDGVKFEILHPIATEQWSANDGSCVLRVSAGKYSALLTGDIQSAAEERLVSRYGNKLASEVLVVPHHGSKSSSSPDFVRAVRPRFALVPAGWRNRWGFPRPEVVERYEAIQARVETTGIHGALQVRISNERGVEQFNRWREQSRRIWRAG